LVAPKVITVIEFESCGVAGLNEPPKNFADPLSVALLKLLPPGSSGPVEAAVSVPAANP
jgi:hypothetical protein